MKNLKINENLKNSLSDLIESKDTRAFLFRTRFERVMLKIIKYSKAENNVKLYKLSLECLKKMKGICDKSNMTSDGVLRSYGLLVDDMKEIYSHI